MAGPGLSRNDADDDEEGGGFDLALTLRPIAIALLPPANV